MEERGETSNVSREHAPSPTITTTSSPSGISSTIYMKGEDGDDNGSDASPGGDTWENNKEDTGVILIKDKKGNQPVGIRKGQEETPKVSTNTGGSTSAPDDESQDTRRTSRRLAGIRPEFLALVVQKEEEDPDIPMTLDDARRGKHAERWNAACLKEMKNMSERNVFELVSPPKGRHIITSKWVFALKRNETGEVIDFKARVVARGFTQKKGVDYEETFSAVATMDSLRLIIAMAAEEDLRLEHIDVTAA